MYCPRSTIEQQVGRLSKMRIAAVRPPRPTGILLKYQLCRTRQAALSPLITRWIHFPGMWLLDIDDPLLLAVDIMRLKTCKIQVK